VIEPAALQARAEHDVVVANILSGILVELAPQLARLCRAGARIALSGILATQGRQVTDACAPWFDLLVAQERDGWLLITGVATPRR
jgi:ribosomal protein L11 methyltransferase